MIEPYGWEVSWLRHQILNRNTAITTMILADTATEADLHEGHGLWPIVQSRTTRPARRRTP
jgi:hypothetical protein